MPETMTVARQQEFLAEGTRTAVLVTVRASGRPHAVPVWYAVDGSDIVLFTGSETVKGRALLANPSVTVVVDDDVPPFSYVSIEGTAEVSRDPAVLRRYVELVAARYLPADQAAGFLEFGLAPGNLAVRIRPTKVIAQDRVAG